MNLFFIFSVLLLIAAEAASQRTLRFVSWNVGDNKMMDGGFDPTTVRQLLGLQGVNNYSMTFFDIYAISLQENCHYCDSDKLDRLANIFVNALNSEKRFIYQYIGQMTTRVNKNCHAVSCRLGQHGSTHMIVIAKRGMASIISTFHRKKCMGGWFKNSEKGIAVVKFHVRGINKNICVGGLHLDSNEASERRECFEKFLNEHSGKLSDCSAIIYGGDFNTRTGDKGGKKQSRNLTPEIIQSLKERDELRGLRPYKGTKLLNIIDAYHGRFFTEGLLNFAPTYSLKPAKECDGGWPCYRGDRPPSWTDRIICSKCNLYSYFALQIHKSDHMPVIAIYTL